MIKNIERLLVLAFLFILSGCSLVPNLSGGNARAVLMPQYIVGQYGTQAVVNPILSADIDHLTLELRYSPSLTLVANRDISKGELTNPIVFNNLRANTGYRVVAIAYKTSDASQVISTGDVDSYTEFTTTSDDAPAIAPLKVRLKDVAFNGVGTSSFAVTPGSYVTGTSKMSITCMGKVFTLSGDPASAGYIDGAGASVRMSSPSGLALGSGYLYFADSGNNRIRRIALATTEVTTIAGQSAAGSVDAIGTSAKFYTPQGLALWNGYLYVSDFYSNRIRRIDLATNEVTTIAGGSGGSADGTGTAAQFYRPVGLAIDNGILYVADSNYQLIRRVDLATNAVTTIGTLTGYPKGITVQNGIIYCPFYKYGNKMWQYNIAAGTGGIVSSEGGFSSSWITADDDGYLFIAANNYVWKLNPTVNTIVQFAGGTSGYADGTGTAAQFSGPTGIVMDKESGILYVSDSSNNCIRIIY